ncbi:TRAP transporter small permease [Mesorhizobium sp. L-8-3]|uniref:TRAP transporter small permease n=1 Tax=Mesorhizobium sp. L-8-3 TaxID=2744522 RepID=UPI0019262B70|nr:TRAP transporter small permease [Mesorhizobium sp. L-8-3]BCH20280.1 TRAP transporter small permease protein [Mesorhizobium sp. L-8-3]
MIEALNRVVDWIENALVTILMLTATIVAITQVVARYVFNNSIYWSEELILYSLITMSFLTMGMGVRYGAHISVEAAYAFSGRRLSQALRIGSACLGLIFAGALIYYGSRLSINTLRMGQLSPAMRAPVGYIYLVIPAAGAFMTLRYLLVLGNLLAGREYVPPQADIKNT